MEYQGFNIGGKRVAMVHPNKKPTIPPRESIPWWWHPSRAGVRLGPPSFRQKLQDFHPDLEITWDAYHENWLLWARKPQIQHPICWGWKLIHSGIAPWNLDNRVFAYLYGVDGRRYAGGRQYFDTVARETARDAERAERFNDDERDAQARETYRDRVRPKVSGFHAK